MKRSTSGASGSRYPNAGEAFLGVVRHLLTDGAHVPAVNTGSDSARRSGTYERIAHGVYLDNPIDRIVSTGFSKLNLPVAAARFVWMMSASNRLADIAFYEPKVKGFTDDGVIVPGSSYGLRILQAAPGIDQLAGAIARLREDSSTRRAAISIYQPTDTIRSSKDIPCAFGLMYHIRGGALHATTIMRSNNAVGLLPFNLFEFSMLAEVVAREAGVTPGPLFHFAGSMHLYESDKERVSSAIRDAEQMHAPVMVPMPANPSPMAQIRELIKLEAEFRHGSAAIGNTTISEWIARTEGILHPYWQQLALLLLAAICSKNEAVDAHKRVRSKLEPYFAEHLPTISSSSAQAPALAPELIMNDLFKPNTPSEAVQPLTRTRLNDQIIAFSVAYEKKKGRPIGAAALFDVQRQFWDRLAARGANDTLTEDEFIAALERRLTLPGA